MCVSGCFVRYRTGSKTAADFRGGANDRPPDPLEGLKAMAGSLDADWEQGTPRVSLWPSCLWLSLPRNHERQSQCLIFTALNSTGVAAS
jgi:hypothetical protein